jgi:hypothetical protein
VEAGRWTPVSPQFGSKGSLALPGLRSRAYGGAAQSEIWSEVDRAAAGLGVTQGPTRSLQEVYDDPDVRGKAADYARGLRLPTQPDAVGFVAASGGTIAGVEVFGSPAVYRALRDKLIRSYALAALRHPDSQARPNTATAARYLARLWSENCRRMPSRAVGAGTWLRLLNTRSDTTGVALVDRDLVVHASAYPDAGPVEIQVPDFEGTPVPRPGVQQWQREGW